MRNVGKGKIVLRLGKLRFYLELLNVLESGFLRVPINKFKFRGMTITGDILSMYIDTYYENGEAQTFILSYYMYQDDKLDGINIPVK